MSFTGICWPEELAVPAAPEDYCTRYGIERPAPIMKTPAVLSCRRSQRVATMEELKASVGKWHAKSRDRHVFPGARRAE